MTTSTPTRILDLLAAACSRLRAGDADGAGWVFHRSMSESDRLGFDLFLLSTGDELAWQAGTCESRFAERVRRMVAGLAEGETDRVGDDSPDFDYDGR